MKNVSPVKIWRKQKKIHKLLGQTGKVVSWTKIHTPPVGFAEKAPYPVVLVKMDKVGAYGNTPVLVGQLVDYDGEVKKGLPVKTVYRRIGKVHQEGVINYGLKFKALGSQ